MIEAVILFLDQHMMSCFWLKNFGMICPGCGMQRALIAMLQGNLIESFKLYPALIPTIVMLSTLILHLIFKWRKGHVTLKWMYFVTITFIVTNFIIKLI